MKPKILTFAGRGKLVRTEDTEAMRKLVAGLSQALEVREAVTA